MKEHNLSIRNILILHVFLLFNSLLATSSKVASQETFMSMRFLLFYGISLFNMGLYAIVWQQLLKKMQLTTVYSNKAICMIWTVLWGALFFREHITIWKIIGICIIIAGVILVVRSDSISKE